uniref:Uncharacterized protein n=1 Tax=Pipistrellus kuhlii TaxID=59472 RepID=A0A7J7VBM7_PIPKU|nr:hypothetical protein mPipKuh1_008537 [Pipistrellus kuhlii]
MGKRPRVRIENTQNHEDRKSRCLAVTKCVPVCRQAPVPGESGALHVVVMVTHAGLGGSVHVDALALKEMPRPRSSPPPGLDVKSWFPVPSNGTECRSRGGPVRWQRGTGSGRYRHWESGLRLRV